MFERIKNAIINGDVVDPALIKLPIGGKLTKKKWKASTRSHETFTSAEGSHMWGVTSHMIAEPLGIDHLTVSNDVATHVQHDRRILPGQLNVGEAPMSID